MRVIGGKYGGQNLVSFKADHIRPTTDRVKESLFNILPDLEGADVVDLFCGTGNLGIEALSRGARHVTFVDASEKSLSILRANLQKLNITEPTLILRKDVLKFVRNYSGDGYDFVFIDPPFTEEMADQVLTTVEGSEVMRQTSILAIESARREKLLDDYGVLRRFDSRPFGDKLLSLFRRGD